MDIQTGHCEAAGLAGLRESNYQAANNSKYDLEVTINDGFDSENAICVLLSPSC
jgi:hypothetical protein